MISKFDNWKIKKILSDENIEYIEDEEKISITSARTKEEILKKAIATLITIQVACDYEKGSEKFIECRKFMSNLLDKYEARNYLSAREKSIFDNDIQPIEAKVMIDSYEAVAVLLWSVGIIKKIPSPVHECDHDYMIKALASCDSFDMIDKHTKLLKLKKIFFMFALTRKYYLFGRKNNYSRLNRKIINERIKAFRWVLNLEDKWI